VVLGLGVGVGIFGVNFGWHFAVWLMEKR
jgi:hypothetical protein